MGVNFQRRNFLKTSAAAAGTIAILGPASQSLAATCGLTPPQTAGPFYPGESHFTADNDLTFIPGNSIRALGQIIYIKGKVLDASCNPIVNANVEIWQACDSGKYNNSRDPNPAPLDPNFRFWSEVFTNSNGEYWFKTIIPGAYPADQGWVRPPHIHFKITCLGYRELVTQMYFKGNPLNDGDLILKQIVPGQRESVIVDFQASPPDLEPGSLMGSFDITLRSVRA